MFVSIGTVVALVGTEVIPTALGSIHAPYWVLTILGGCFAAAGLFIVLKSLHQARRSARQRRMRIRCPQQPWLGDFPWDRNGYTPPRWKSVLGAIAPAVFIAAFSVPFDWIGFFARPQIFWPFAIAGGLMALAALSLLGYAGYLLLQKLRFGTTTVYWPSFPLPIGKPCTVYWRAPRARLDRHKWQATVRLIEEYFIVRGTGKNRSSQLVFDALFEAPVTLHAGGLQPGARHRLSFTIPSGLPSTALSADIGDRTPPRYYLLIVACERQGMDFKEHYLLPLYS